MDAHDRVEWGDAEQASSFIWRDLISSWSLVRLARTVSITLLWWVMMSFRVVTSRVRLSKPVAPLSPPLKNLRAGVSLMPVNVVSINSLLRLSPLVILLKSDGGDNLNGGLGPSSTMPAVARFVLTVGPCPAWRWLSLYTRRIFLLHGNGNHSSQIYDSWFQERVQNKIPNALLYWFASELVHTLS